MSSSPLSTPSKMARATDSGEALGMSKPRVMSVSVGPVRMAWTRTPRPASRARSDCVRLNAAALEIAYAGSEREGGDGHRRHVVDDGSPRTGQQRQEGLDHAVGAEEVDGQVLLEHGTIAQVVEQRDSGVVDEDIERFDFSAAA